MGMIMENFRRYQEVVEAEYGPSDNVIYLFESNQKVPTTTTLDELREQNNSGKISDEEYNGLVKAHIMFKDMAVDPYLASAGIAGDWPYGRGCYISEDKQFIVWCVHS